MIWVCFYLEFEGEGVSPRSLYSTCVHTTQAFFGLAVGFGPVWPAWETPAGSLKVPDML